MKNRAARGHFRLTVCFAAKPLPPEDFRRHPAFPIWPPTRHDCARLHCAKHFRQPKVADLCHNRAVALLFNENIARVHVGVERPLILGQERRVYVLQPLDNVSHEPFGQPV